MSAATMNEMDRLVRVNREQADRIAELEQWQRDMVAKAAEQSHGGYREMGQRAAKAESERDEAFAKGKQAFDDLRRVEAERDALADKLAESDHALMQLGRLKAEWQAEALEEVAMDVRADYGHHTQYNVSLLAAGVEGYARAKRRQAEESTNGHH